MTHWTRSKEYARSISGVQKALRTLKRDSRLDNILWAHLLDNAGLLNEDLLAGSTTAAAKLFHRRNNVHALLDFTENDMLAIKLSRIMSTA